MPSRLDTVRSAYETLRKPDGLAILADEFLAPDVELDFSALPDGRVLKGVDAFREFRQDYPWMGHLRVEPEDIVEVEGDRVLVTVRVRSVSPAMDAELEGRFAHLITFLGDRVTRWRLFTDRAEARRAAGLNAGSASAGVSAGVTRQNVELVRRFYELAQAYRIRRWDHLEILAKTVVFRPIAEWPDAGERHGRHEFRKFMESFWSGEAWQEIAFVATTHFAIGDKVITRLDLTGRGRGSAADTHGRVYNVATIDSGRIVRFEDFTARDDALAAAWRTTVVSPNVDTVRKSLELINAEGPRAQSLLAWTWHPDIRWTSAMGESVYVGHEGMRRYFDELFASFYELSFDDPEYCEIDRQVLALYTLRGLRSQSAVERVQPGAAIWRFAGDKIIEGRSFLSHEEGLEMAGLG